MTTITFHDSAGRPVDGATVAITAPPGEVTDLGYITDETGAIALPVPTPGTYRFALSGADGRRLTATVALTGEGEASVTVRDAGRAPGAPAS